MDTTQQITLSQAFAHCASTGSYWLWIAIALVACGITCFLWYKAAQKSEVNIYVRLFLTFAMIAAIVCSILVRPVNVRVNTSSAAAARGHFLGY